MTAIPYYKTTRDVEYTLNAAGVHPDKVYKTKGVYVARFGFFYAIGQTAEGWAEKVKAAGRFDVLEAHMYFNIWPKDSYFEVRFVSKTV